VRDFHVDALRVDAVASMLYLDYSREPGQWLPNARGGRENLEAVDFLRELNDVVRAEAPGAIAIAEESTAWPGVTAPTGDGGLGFGMKWNMGWMHDTLEYFQREPIHRRFHHDELTFSMVYAFSERFVLPLSHDEVVHGKRSLVDKMPGDDWQKFANLRALYGYMFAQPGKKLLFMGGEFGQWREWRHDHSLDWHQRPYPPHAGTERWVSDLNHLYRAEPALHQGDCHAGGFEWVDASDTASSVMSFLRRGDDGSSVLVVCNFTPVPRHNYRVGVPHGGYWRELLNSDATVYWGSGQGNAGGVTAEPESWNGRPYSVKLTLPPLGILFFKGS
jgi:1,4-alpha-glucan branching enzyme